MGYWSDGEKRRAFEERRRAYLSWLLCFARAGRCSWCKVAMGIGLRVKTCDQCAASIAAQRGRPLVIGGVG